MKSNGEIPPGAAKAEVGWGKQAVPRADSGPPPGISEAERRRASRYALVHFVWFKVVEEEPDKTEGSLEGVCKIADVSQTGMGLYATVAVPVGKTAFFEIVTRHFSLSCVGQFVYSRKADERYYRVGVRFAIVPPNDRLLLDQYFASKEEL
jgi:c-di-GMP-binding flagellar brake protein YcgR